MRQKIQGGWEEITSRNHEEEGHPCRPQENYCPLHSPQCSRRQQQRFRTRQRNEETQGMQRLIQWEESCQAHQLVQIDNLATSEIERNYGFIPNTNISTRLNTRHVLGNISTGVYFTNFTNKHFRDLTTKKSNPAAAATVLGFGLKFIPIPKKSIHQDDVDKAVKRFDQDFYLKVFFADKDTNLDDKEPIKKL
jgi:hypothetical protein